MAATYTILSQTPAFELIPPNKLRRVTEVIAQAQPSGVIFYLRFPPAAYTKATVALDCNAVATQLNKDMNVDGVVGIRIEQDIDANNQLTEWGVTTVESDSGNSQGEIRDIETYLFSSEFVKRVTALRNKLNDIEDG